MTKKQIIILVTLLSLVTVAGVGYAVYKISRPSNDVQAATETADYGQYTELLNPGTTDTIPLGEKQESSNSGGLSVTDSSPSGAQLGSGRQSNSIAGSTSSSSSAPSTASFAEYNQYKDKTEVYYGDIQQGTGAVAQKDSQLAVTYKGYLTNGTMFDQSKTLSNGQLQPLLFSLGGGQLIPGFEQGVAGMKAGGSRRIIIPPSLGYGDKANNGIPANSVLIFDVQLLTVQ